MAGLVMVVIEMIGILAWLPPAGFGAGHAAGLPAFSRTLPPGAGLLLLAAYGLGTFGGVWVTTRYSVRRTVRQGWTLGLVLLAAGAVNFLRSPLPGWFMAVALALGLALAGAAVRLGRPRLAD